MRAFLIWLIEPLHLRLWRFMRRSGIGGPLEARAAR